MATLEEEKAEHDSLRTQLKQLTEIDADSLVRADELGQALSFEKGLPYFQRVLRLFRDLAESNLDTLPFQQLQNLKNTATEANRLFLDIQQFSLEGHPQNPTQARDSLIDNIRDQYDHWFEQVAPAIAYLVRKGTDFERLEQEAREQASSIERLQTELQSKSEEIIVETQGVLEQVRRRSPGGRCCPARRSVQE